jgi:hypothetical protein
MAPRLEGRLIAVEGRNCWRRAHARRTAFLIDGAAYFAAFADAAAVAERSLFILGWDIHGGIRLRRDAGRRASERGTEALGAAEEHVEGGAPHGGAPEVGEAPADGSVTRDALAALQIDDGVETVHGAEPPESRAGEVVHRGERLALGVRRAEQGEHPVGQPAREIVHAHDAEVRIAERQAVDRRHVGVPARHEHAAELAEECGRAPDMLEDLRAVDEVDAAVPDRQPLAITANEAEHPTVARRRCGRESLDRFAAARGIELDRDDPRAARDVRAAPQRLPPTAEVEDDAATHRAGDRFDPGDEVDAALDRVPEGRHGG